VRFWDSSAVVPLVAAEAASDALMKLKKRDPRMWVWFGSRVEVSSALNRRRRDGGLTAASLTAALTRLDQLAMMWDEITPSDRLRSTAEKVLRVHDLGAGDSLQLAAALEASDGQPGNLEFVCLDRRLSLAASLEGFHIADI
jgi:predicted nucleic acid-binding protein